MRASGRGDCKVPQTPFNGAAMPCLTAHGRRWQQPHQAATGQNYAHSKDTLHMGLVKFPAEVDALTCNLEADANARKAAIDDALAQRGE